jgi:hypothetical protein
MAGKKNEKEKEGEEKGGKRKERRGVIVIPE